ncbi:hypothetical protein SAMN02910317_01413 [Ruminococcaceae bacterium FB2012]|nr:hypothetical protein SAMN02910317_01413 [Ruminococcaceae bacterium FB2012]
MKREKNPFSKFFDNKLKALNERTGQSLTKRDIAYKLGVGNEMFRKIVNKNKPNQDRDCIIAVAAVLELNTDETNEAIQIYDVNLPQLKAADTDVQTRDDLIIDILENQTIDHLSIQDIDNLLSSRGFPILHVIDHRNKLLVENDNIYICVDNNNGDNCIRYNLEDYYYGDIYDSLETEFVYKTNRFSTKMKIVCTTDNSEYWLSCIYDIRYDKERHKTKGTYLYGYVRDSKSFVRIPDINSEIHLKQFYLKMKYQIKFEKRKILSALNDTRSYHERISAKVIANELHVFYETYNYTVPELCEYYLMDYVNGEYTLYVSNESRFMRLYLSVQEYHDMFGRSVDKYLDEYSSVETIENAVAKANLDRKGVIQLRIDAFHNAQDKINSLIGKLRDGKAHIRNLKAIYDNELDVLSYFKVEDDFQSSNDPQYGEIKGIGIDKISVTLPDDVQIELTFDNLCAGFSLGLNTIEEVGSFLIKHKTLELTELL